MGGSESDEEGEDGDEIGEASESEGADEITQSDEADEDTRLEVGAPAAGEEALGLNLPCPRRICCRDGDASSSPMVLPDDGTCEAGWGVCDASSKRCEYDGTSWMMMGPLPSPRSTGATEREVSGLAAGGDGAGGGGSGTGLVVGLLLGGIAGGALLVAVGMSLWRGCQSPPTPPQQQRQDSRGRRQSRVVAPTGRPPRGSPAWVDQMHAPPRAHAAWGQPVAVGRRVDSGTWAAGELSVGKLAPMRSPRSPRRAPPRGAWNTELTRAQSQCRRSGTKARPPSMRGARV